MTKSPRFTGGFFIGPHSAVMTMPATIADISSIFCQNVHISPVTNSWYDTCNVRKEIDTTI